VNPGYLFKKLLVDFAVTVLEYFKREKESLAQDNLTQGLDEASLKSCLRRHILINHIGLVPYFDHTVDDASQFLYYTGPKIKVMPRSDELVGRLTGLGVQELTQCVDAKIYFPGNVAAKKRDRPTLFNPVSPSSSRVAKCRK
jgi:hypothetical protein